MSLALYVGVQSGSHLYLPHMGYVRCLRRFGWTVDELSAAHATEMHLGNYDLIIWNGMCPETVLRSIRPQSQTLVLMNGAGDNLSHYGKYADRIAVATSSLAYFDEMRTPLGWRHLNPRRALSRQYFHTLRHARYFHRFASPRFWRALGIPLLYLPFAADPEIFHPTGVTPDLVWSFVGHIRARVLVHQLMKESDRRGWAYEVHSPQTGNPLEPLALNDLYNRSMIGFNEQHQMHFGRELNERTFDLGMAGRLQISDMGWLAAQETGRFARFYNGNVGAARDLGYILRLLSNRDLPDPAAVHAHFSRHHSFVARLAVLSAALGQDLSLGKMDLSHGQVAYDGVIHTPAVI
ncbi:hypothetical protein OG470_17725 [Micromonospora sp. NBC_00389]|uniref:hypothetical protein n=1 Tax=Micromonospora sp. NBC_00389 TaxID=2903586 RepID=UPI002E1EB9EB